MALIGSIISRSLRIRKKIKIQVAEPRTYQRNCLRWLLDHGQYTAFGKHYGFPTILAQKLDWEAEFRQKVPFHCYDDMFNNWWYRIQAGEENVTWPGSVKYFALSSGTSASSSKHIPVTQDMIRCIKKVGFKQFYSMTNFNIPSRIFEKGVLMLGGTTTLMKQGDYFEGDMSGISAKNIPRFLANIYYKPGRKISKQPEWEKRIKLIVENAPRWDVGILCGVPAWAQIVLEKIIQEYKLNSIHDLWPNLRVYIHGGVAFEPYRESFHSIFSKSVTFIETYMASEGSFGFQARPNTKGIKLVLNAGIFFEFIPFNETCFDAEGNLIGQPQSFFIDEVKEGVHYAMVLTTCSGAWRYLIGDVIQFTNVVEHEIIIVGRTKQFLSLCGEHLSVDNMNKAIETVAREMQVSVNEFTVFGFKCNGLFAHKWYVGSNNSIDVDAFKKMLDTTLCKLNDDYAVERISALSEIFVEIISPEDFINYMKQEGKYGAMQKFPRVLKGEQLEKWEKYLADKKAS